MILSMSFYNLEALGVPRCLRIHPMNCKRIFLTGYILVQNIDISRLQLEQGRNENTIVHEPYNEESLNSEVLFQTTGPVQ